MTSSISSLGINIPNPLIIQISRYTSFAYQHEEAFLKKFFPDFKHIELEELYLGSCFSNVTISEDHHRISDRISTVEFLKWVDSFQK